jgi:hypothetical protein
MQQLTAPTKAPSMARQRAIDAQSGFTTRQQFNNPPNGMYSIAQSSALPGHGTMGSMNNNNVHPNVRGSFSGARNIPPDMVGNVYGHY